MQRSTPRRIAYLLLALTAQAAGPAHAESANGLRVVSVGIQGNQMYVTFSSTPPGCPGPIVYQAADTTGQFAMSLALTARTTGLPVARTDYHRQNGTGPCWLDLLEL